MILESTKGEAIIAAGIVRQSIVFTFSGSLLFVKDADVNISKTKYMNNAKIIKNIIDLYSFRISAVAVPCSDKELIIFYIIINPHAVLCASLKEPYHKMP